MHQPLKKSQVEPESVPTNSLVTRRSVAKRLLAIAAPMIVTQYTLVLMQFADAWMLGRLGSRELAAITPPGLLILVVVHFGAGFFSSVVTLVAHAFGRGDRGECDRYGWQGVFIALGAGLAAFVFWPVAPSIFALFGHARELQVLEVAYFQVSLCSILPQFLSLAVMNYFIGIHRTGLAMVGSFVGMGTNVLFNFALIFGYWGFPEMGFIGAAWGTVGASFCQLLFFWFLFLSFTQGNRVSGWDRAKLSTLSRMGLPAGVQGAVDILSWGVILTALIGQYGTPHLAAATIMIRCMQISFLPSDGLGAALQTVIGATLGAGRGHLVRLQAHVAIEMIAAYMMVMGFLFYVFREDIMSLFSSDPEVIRIGVQCMVFVSFFQIFDALNVTYINALHGAGDTMWPSVLNGIFCIVILVGGGISIIHYAPHLQSFGVWLVASVYILAQGACFWWRWRSGRWKRFLATDP